ncbi:radical SAM protein [Methanotorris igneus]|nr:radical SAM protein [Methanotorris igneus]
MLLERYLKVSENKLPAKFLISKSIKVDNFAKKDIDELWEMHKNAMDEFKETTNIKDIKITHPNLLDLKIEIAKKIFENCHFCEHKCYVNRKKELGFCKIGESYYSSEFLHYGEEDVLIPSHTIFFCGCNFKCVFCQNWEISQIYFENLPVENYCKKVNRKLMAKIIEEKRAISKNVNFVGGEPTPHLLTILEILRHVNVNIPVVWNSNMYMSEEAMHLLDGVVDLWLSDFKFGNDRCAERLSKIKNYCKVVKRNHLMIKGEDIIIRHLVMPNHLECCTERIFKWIGKHLDAKVNVMFQYRPEYKAILYEDIDRALNHEEMAKALLLAKKYGLDTDI